jgi:hypothetical protein
MADWNQKATWDSWYSLPLELWGYPNTRPRIMLHYHRWVLEGTLRIQGERLVNLPGVPSINKIVVIGCGYNWTVEYLLEQGIQAFGTEISTYINGSVAQTEEAELRAAITAVGLDPDVDTIIGPGNVPINPLVLAREWGWEGKTLVARNPARNKSTTVILNEDLTTNGSRNKVKNELNGLDVILTQLVIDTMDDTAALDFIQNVDDTRPNPACTVVHMVVPSDFMGGNPDPDLNAKTMAQWRSFLDTNGFSDHKLINVNNDVWVLE